MKWVLMGFVALFTVTALDGLSRAQWDDGFTRGLAQGRALAAADQREQERGYMAAGLCHYSKVACGGGR